MNDKVDKPKVDVMLAKLFIKQISLEALEVHMNEEF